jgi:cell division protein ZapD
VISYEYPLNERIRTLLRLEDLFARVDFFIAQERGLEHHSALLVLFEICEVASRADLKSDLLQEMERQKQMLEPLRNNPAISEEALDGLLKNIDVTTLKLRGMMGKVGQHLRDNEWLMSIKQRTSIPGGVCEFDLPSYHFWLNQDVELRRKELSVWLEPMLAIRDGIIIVMRMLRDSGNAVGYVAQHGAFQQMLSGRVVQMLRIRLDAGVPCFPEISANKYAINIRFTALGGPQKPRTCEQDIEFDMTLCTL